MNINKREAPRRVLEEIIRYIEVHDYAPSVRELCALTGYNSLSTISHHMHALFDAGYIETDIPQEIGAARAYRIGERAYEEGYAVRRVQQHTGV